MIGLPTTQGGAQQGGAQHGGKQQQEGAVQGGCPLHGGGVLSCGVALSVLGPTGSLRETTVHCSRF